MAFIPAFLVLLGVVTAATFMSRRWSFSSAGRRPGRRHWITRTVCGVLGASIVVALAAITFRDACRAYVEPAPTAFKVPTLPPPGVKNDYKPLQAGRFLLHVAVVSGTGGAQVPLYGKTYELQWPRDAGRSFHSSLESGGVKFNWQLEISELRRYQYKSEERLEVQGSRNLRARAPDFMSSGSGGLHFPEAVGIGRNTEAAAFFSIARPASDARLVFLLDLTPVRDEDPLRPGALDDVLAIRGTGRWAAEMAVALSGTRRRADTGSPAGALVWRLQANLLVLLAAAILFAQLFRRRSLGFVKAAACLLLFVGALDRGVLRIHQSRLKDEGRPLQQRFVAGSLLPSTSFFRKTALRDLDETAADEGAPEPLRDLARRLAETERKYHFP